MPAFAPVADSVELTVISEKSFSIARLALISTHLTLVACGQSKESVNAQQPEPKNEKKTSRENSSAAPVFTGTTRIISTASGMQMKIAAQRADVINPKFIYAFQGKGTHVTWDIGGAKAAYERIPTLRQETNRTGLARGDVVVTGNSSGSVLAAWFTCRGFTAESIRDAQTIMSQFPPELVKESTSEKILEILAAIKQGREFGSSINSMIPMVETITGKGSCVPQLPTVITASNQDINDRRGWLASPIAQTRTFDMGDFSYFENRYGANYRPVKIGKVCTYFADPVMFRYLVENVSSEERLCDVRLMETAEDVKLAVLASIAEPTYFLPIGETTDAKLIRYMAPAVERKPRVYNGGFSMPGVMQDVKRLFPLSKALASGRWDYSTTENTVMKTWYDVDLNDVQEVSRWWADLEVFPTEAEKTSLLERPDNLTGSALSQRYAYEMNLGYQRALVCLKKGSGCLAPRKSIVQGIDMYRPVFTKAAGQSAAGPVRTRQGLDEFIQ